MLHVHIVIWIVTNLCSGTPSILMQKFNNVVCKLRMVDTESSPLYSKTAHPGSSSPTLFLLEDGIPGLYQQRPTSPPFLWHRHDGCGEKEDMGSLRFDLFSHTNYYCRI